MSEYSLSEYQSRVATDGEHSREYFCSHADGVMVIVLSADKPGNYTGTVDFEDGHQSPRVAAGNKIISTGSFGNGLKFETQVLVKNQGGTVTAEGSGIHFSDCDSVVVLAAAGTNYAFDASKKFVFGDPHEAVGKRIDAAGAKKPGGLLAAHVADYKALFDQCEINLGASRPEQNELPTNDQSRKLGAADGMDATAVVGF